MKRHEKLRKSLSMLLTVVMVFTMIPVISVTLSPKAQAYGTYSKPYSTEYYYASGTAFIEALCVGYDSSSASTVKSQMQSAGWTPVSNFLDMMQSWSGTKNIYVGYKTTTDPTNALTDIEFFDSDDAHSNYDWHGKNSGWANKNTGTDTCNGTSATGVKDKNTGIVFFRAGGSPMTAYSKDGIVDFLMGMGSGYGYEYLCATKNRSAGAAITSVDCFSGTSSGWTMATCLARGCGAHSSAHGHSTRYVGYKRLTATVNSATLRSNYTAALNKYNESNYSAKYTSASRSALETALTNAENTLKDLNDGYTTRSQDTINSYATALSSAVSGMALNTYTVTFKGYTSGTTVGTLKTQTVSYGGSAAAPTVSTTYDSSNHYTFKSWSGDAYTNVTSARTVTATYNTVAHSYGNWSNNVSGASGSHKRSCSCGYVQTQSHSFGSVVTAPTCTAQGYTTHTCSVCGNSYKDSTTNATGHHYTGAPVWGAWTDENTVVATFKCDDCDETITPEVTVTPDVHAETCTEGGYTVYTATVTNNGTTYSNPTTKRVENNPATGHTYTASAESDWTWTRDGDTYTVTVAVSCEKCDDTKTLDADVEVTASEAAGHLTDGFKTYKATAAIGGQTFTAEKTDVIEAEGHSLVHHPAAASTRCDEYGTVEYWSCKGCELLFSDGDAENTITDISDHAYGPHSFTAQDTAEDYFNTAATCTAKATYFKSCEYCGLKGEDTFETGEFDYGNHSTDETVTLNAKTATCNEDGYTGDLCCKACETVLTPGEVISASGVEHQWGDWAVTTEPKCGVAGEETRECAICHDTETRPVAALEHAFGEWYVKSAAGCTEDGVEERACANCGETETRPIPAPGHDWGEWTDDAQDAPTCSKDGKQNRVCARCGETETREITASEKGHSIRQPNEEREGYCADCGRYRCLFCEKDDKMHEVSDSSIMSFFVHVVHYFYHLFSNFRYTLSHR